MIGNVFASTCGQQQKILGNELPFWIRGSGIIKTWRIGLKANSADLWQPNARRQTETAIMALGQLMDHELYDH